eukprot:1857352-Amphidinium_carterae.3
MTHVPHVCHVGPSLHRVLLHQACHHPHRRLHRHLHRRLPETWVSHCSCVHPLLHCQCCLLAQLLASQAQLLLFVARIEVGALRAADQDRWPTTVSFGVSSTLSLLRWCSWMSTVSRS